MTQPAKSQEPSMEEILASIRRIIADDDATKSTQRAPDPPRAEAQPVAPPAIAPRPSFEPESEPMDEEAAGDEAADQAADILDLTESMASPPPPAAPDPSVMANSAPQFRTIDGSSDVGYEEASERVPAAPMPPPRAHAEDRAQLISSEASAAVDSAFNALAQTVLVQNARTLEDLVREMLRPMLKTWLDDNLPGMVERLVRAEIERVSRGRTS
jgi:uncharacterized protein